MKKWVLAAIASVVVVIVIAATLMTINLNGNETRPPSVPLDPELVAGEGEVEISWKAPTSNGTSDIVRYNVYLYSAADAEQYIEKRTASEERFVWTGLDGETRYFFRVSASNEDGEGPMTGLFDVTTLRIVIVPNATDIVLDANEIGAEYDLDSIGTVRSADLIENGTRSYVIAEYTVPASDPLNTWRYVSIEVCVCETSEEADGLFWAYFNNYSISDAAAYDDIGLGNESRYYKEYDSESGSYGLIADGWFRSGSIVVHMEFDSTYCDIPATNNWFRSLMEDQLEKAIANSDV